MAIGCPKMDDADDDLSSEDAQEPDAEGADAEEPEGHPAQQAQDDDLIALTERQSGADERIGGSKVAGESGRSVR